MDPLSRNTSQLPPLHLATCPLLMYMYVFESRTMEDIIEILGLIEAHPDPIPK